MGLNASQRHHGCPINMPVFVLRFFEHIGRLTILNAVILRKACSLNGAPGGASPEPGDHLIKGGGADVCPGVRPATHARTRRVFPALAPLAALSPRYP